MVVMLGYVIGAREMALAAEGVAVESQCGGVRVVAIAAADAGRVHLALQE